MDIHFQKAFAPKWMWRKLFGTQIEFPIFLFRVAIPHTTRTSQNKEKNLSSIEGFCIIYGLNSLICLFGVARILLHLGSFRMSRVRVWNQQTEFNFRPRILYLLRNNVLGKGTIKIKKIFLKIFLKILKLSFLKIFLK